MLSDDGRRVAAILEAACREATEFLDGLDQHPAGQQVPAIPPLGLPAVGLGAEGALAQLRQRYSPWMSGSVGPRYFGFVTGGTTPAALAGDLLVSTFDQNLSDAGESAARQLALDSLAMVRQLLELPESFDGAFVTGATTASLVALATARQWVGRQRGRNVSRDGLEGLGPIRVLSGTAHASISKVLSVTGIGRKSLRPVATLDGREAVDVGALRDALREVEAAGDGPAIVVANSGTVNTCDFDDLDAIAALRAEYPFWLHVDGAFGAVAAASAKYRELIAGLDQSDSVAIDAHKLLNVPYDCAVVFSRYLELQGEVFNSGSSYLPADVGPDTFIHLTPENSQRLRALPVWMTLAAYGQIGYAEVVENCCRHASWLGEMVAGDPRFELLAPVRLNGVCFSLISNGAPCSVEQVSSFLSHLTAGGVAFMTPTTYGGRPAVRASISNWRTGAEDMKRTWRAIQDAAEKSLR